MTDAAGVMAALVVERRARGLRQLDIAAMIGVGQQEISYWERGQYLTLRGLVAYADALGFAVTMDLIPRD